MSTNACIARLTDAGFEGCYHHWDGIPSELGAKLYREALVRGTKPLLKLLLDDHPAGWSSIVGTDLDREAGFTEHPPAFGTPEYAENTRKPSCYCHGDRHEEPRLLAQDTAKVPWAYAFDEGADTMTILRRKDGRWVLCSVIDLHDARNRRFLSVEPAWKAIERENS